MAVQDREATRATMQEDLEKRERELAAQFKREREQQEEAALLQEARARIASERAAADRAEMFDKVRREAPAALDYSIVLEAEKKLQADVEAYVKVVKDFNDTWNQVFEPVLTQQDPPRDFGLSQVSSGRISIGFREYGQAQPDLPVARAVSKAMAKYFPRRSVNLKG